MRILITNDDGIHSKGLDVLVKAMKDKAKVVVVVPDQERSAVSHSMTLHKPLRLEEIEENTFIINGTPADCVRFGILGLMKKKDIDLVIAGINRGPNLGDDILYSGTVGAAIEGTVLGFPSIAISLVSNGNYYFDVAAEFSCRIVEKIIQYDLSKGIYLNINVPDFPSSQIKGVEITRQGKRIYGREIEQRTDPRGFLYYWIAGESISGIKEQGTDIQAIEEKKISITPLHIDATAYESLEQLRDWKF